MSGELTPAEEEQIVKFLAQRAPDADRRAEVERDPRLRAHLEVLEKVKQRLLAETDGEREREIGAAFAAGPAPGEEEALAALRRAMRGPELRSATSDSEETGHRHVPARRWMPRLLVCMRTGCKWFLTIRTRW